MTEHNVCDKPITHTSLLSPACLYITSANETTFPHFIHHMKTTPGLMFHPNVCSTLMKNPQQTFRAYEPSFIGLMPGDVSSFQLPRVGPSNSVFFSTHSSYRLDKINSDMRNYITNFAADLRWIQDHCLPVPSLLLPCCSGQTSEPAGSLLCWPTQYGRRTEETLKTSEREVTWGKCQQSLMCSSTHWS